MRHLALLVLAALATFPLSAHEHWREPRRVVVIEAPRCSPYDRWEERRWEDRWERRAWHRRHDCDEDRLYFRPRPLERPFKGRVELHLR
jgi:hypothetical protein